MLCRRYEVGKRSQGQRFSEEALDSQRSSIETVGKLEQGLQLCGTAACKPAWEGDRRSIMSADTSSSQRPCQPS